MVRVSRSIFLGFRYVRIHNSNTCKTTIIFGYVTELDWLGYLRPEKIEVPKNPKSIKTQKNLKPQINTKKYSNTQKNPKSYLKSDPRKQKYSFFSNIQNIFLDIEFCLKPETIIENKNQKLKMYL